MLPFGPLPRGARTIVGVLEGEPIGLVGIYPERGRMIMFATLTPKAKSYPQGILRGARRLLEQVAHLEAPICAYADPEIEGSERLLEHLGFVHMAERVYARVA